MEMIFRLLLAGEKLFVVSAPKSGSEPFTGLVAVMRGACSDSDSGGVGVGGCIGHEEIEQQRQRQR